MSINKSFFGHVSMRSFSFILIISFILFNAEAQNQKRADSLIKVWESGKLDTLTELRILHRITAYSSSPKDIITYGNVLLKKSKLYKNSYYKARSYLIIGVGFRMKGDVEPALENLFTSSRICVKNSFNRLLAETYSEIASAYTMGGDFINALKYNTKAVNAFRLLGSKSVLTMTLLNTGFDYYTLEKYDTALLYYNEAESLLDSTFSPIVEAYIIGNRALVKWKIGMHDESIIDLEQAISMLIPLGDDYGISDYYNQLGSIYYELDRPEQAVFYLGKGIKIALEVDLKEQVRDASKLLSEIYREFGDADSAYFYLNQYLAMRDSIQNEEVTRQLANQRADFEIGLKEGELRALEIKRRNQLIMVVMIGSVLLVVGFVGYRYQQTRSRRKLEKQVINQRLAELKALKAQINPHFLFNALNSIQSYILEDQHEVAESYLVKYGKLMRKILNHSNELTILLKDALELLKLYVELEQIRIDGGFKYKVSIDDSIDDSYVKIPAMIIQPFVENAIWHGIADSKGEGVIELSIHPQGELIEINIEDNGKGFNVSKPFVKSSKGVRLVQERLELLKDSEGSESVIEISSEVGKGTKVTLRFPSNFG